MSRKNWKWEDLFNWNWFDCSKSRCDQKSNIIYSGDDLSDFNETKLNSTLKNAFVIQIVMHGQMIPHKFHLDRDTVIFKKNTAISGCITFQGNDISTEDSTCKSNRHYASLIRDGFSSCSPNAQTVDEDNERLYNELQLGHSTRSKHHKKWFEIKGKQSINKVRSMKKSICIPQINIRKWYDRKYVMVDDGKQRILQNVVNYHSSPEKKSISHRNRHQIVTPYSHINLRLPEYFKAGNRCYNILIKQDCLDLLRLFMTKEIAEQLIDDIFVFNSQENHIYIKYFRNTMNYDKYITIMKFSEIVRFCEVLNKAFISSNLEIIPENEIPKTSIVIIDNSCSSINLDNHIHEVLADEELDTMIKIETDPEKQSFLRSIRKMRKSGNSTGYGGQKKKNKYTRKNKFN